MFAGENFVNCNVSAKFANNYSCENFLLYGTLNTRVIQNNLYYTQKHAMILCSPLLNNLYSRGHVAPMTTISSISNTTTNLNDDAVGTHNCVNTISEILLDEQYNSYQTVVYCSSSEILLSTYMITSCHGHGQMNMEHNLE